MPHLPGAAFSVNVADFDGDGNEDVFLSQNFFANQPETPRLDAGGGLLLLGDGAGNLRAVPGQESGQARFAENYTQSAPDPGAQQVCQGFAHWSADHARVVRMIVRYSL